MRVNSASVSVVALAWCLAGGAISFIAATASAQQVEPSSASAARIEFDIAAQRLGDAIAAYSKATGLDILIDGVHAQRLSGTVRGTFTAMEALEAMLAGTGLEARHASATSVVIRASRTEGDMALSPPPLLDAEGMEESGFKEGEVLHQSYAAQVQRALNGTLCASTQTRPGSYRLALQLHVDARGVVDRFRLLSTTGVSDRDAAIRMRLRGLSVGSSPPPSLPQPLVILMLPEGPGAWSDCEQASFGADRRMQ